MKVTEPLPVGTKVQLAAKWLAGAGAQEAKRFTNRVGVITGYRGQLRDIPEPIVTFARSGRRPEVKLFEVPWDRLEIPQES